MLPARTGSGESELVNARSARVCVVVSAVISVLLVLSASALVDVAEALFMIWTPEATLELTLATTVKVAVS